MKNTIKALLRRHTALAIAAAVLVIALGSAALAEFTLSHRAKRVVGSYGVSGVLFSSNILRQTTVAYMKHVATADQNGDQVVVTVCNYAQGNKLEHYPQNITYQITAALVDDDMTAHTAAQGEDFSLASVKPEGSNTELLGSSANVTLSFRQAETMRYVVTFAPGMLITSTTEHPVYIKIDVVRIDENGGPVQQGDGLPTTLSAYLGLMQRTGDTAARWTGAFDEDETNAIGGYSGFNYVITGTGETTLTLSWDTDKVILSDVSLREELGKTLNDVTTTGTMKSVSFDVNSADTVVSTTENGVTTETVTPGKARYALQFYRNTSGSIDNWAALTGAVTCSMPAPAP